MDAQQRKLLELFDSRNSLRSPSELSLGTLPTDLHSVAEELAAQGLLRATIPGGYARTEEGRLALMGPLDVTLYTRPGCHLCHDARDVIVPLLLRFHAHLHEVDIDQDPVLVERYGFDIPVILLGVRRVAKHRVDATQFQRQLEEARRAAGRWRT